MKIIWLFVLLFLIAIIIYKIYKSRKFIKFIGDNIPVGNLFDKYHSKNPLIKIILSKYYNDLNELIKEANPQSVLDVGCGGGYVTNLIKERNNQILISGCDIGRDIINETQTKYRDIPFSVKDIYELNVGDNYVDCGMVTEVLEHLRNPKKAIREVKRISKDYCIFTVPREPIWRIANLLRLAYISELGNTPGHIQNFSIKDFEKLLRDVFKEVKVIKSSIWSIALCKK